ncbi:MAG: molybdenum cofactor biosynthesis protein MoaE [Candidatus Methanofastidiosa archaeon]|nr:molybdenum cofactor biosynthesis protein MoaE [Candidatus Methanofastidiosa archaeon]
MIVIQEGDFDIGGNLDKMRRDDCGAMVTFIGTVKSPVGSERVSHLELECYDEMAIKELERIEGETRDRFDIADMLVIHRVGRIGVGENIVLICVVAVGREAAFDAARYVLDQLKERVPIFKKEFTDDNVYWQG